MLKKTYKRITAILLALAMMVSFTACGGSETNTATNKPTNSDTTIVDTGKAPDCSQLKQELNSSSEILAVAYLGTYENHANYSNFSEIKSFIANSDTAADYPFLNDINESHFVKTDGGELYCLVPAGDDTSITIYEFLFDDDTYSAEMGDMLYNSADGQPVLVMCNQSDIFSNVFVEVIDSDDNFIGFNPFLSGVDNRIEQPYDGDFTVYDFSRYDESYSDYDEEFVNDSQQDNHVSVVAGLPFDTDILPTCDMWTFQIQTANGKADAYFCFIDDGWMEFGYEITPGDRYEVYYEGYWAHFSDNIVEFDLHSLDNWRPDYKERDEINTSVVFWYDESTEALHMAYHSGDVLYDVANVSEFTLYRSSFDS